MKMNRTLGFVTTVALTAGAFAAVAHAGNSTAPAGTATIPATHVSQLTDSSLKPISSGDVSEIRNLLPAARDTNLLFAGPIKSEVTDAGKILISGGANRFAALTTTRGDVCYTVSDTSGVYDDACDADLGDDGITFNALQRSDRGWWVTGLAADDVTSISANLASGSTQSVQVTNGAFVWADTDPSNPPVSLTVKRGGAQYNLTTGVK